MGAHLSTIHGAVQEQFGKQDEGSKGYLTLKELMAVRTLYGINPCHIGVLYHVDRNHDGHFTMEEMQAFATLAQSYARAHRSFDAAYMTAGYTTLCLWHDLATVSGRDRFVQWAMRCFTAGYDLVDLEGSSEQYIHRKAIKALHVLFDVERNLGVDYQGLVDMMQNAAEEQQLLNPNNPDHDDWIPVQVLQTFIESLADGITSIMEISFPDQAELEEVIRSVQAGIAAAAAGKPANVSSSSAVIMPTPPSGPRKSSGRGGVPVLNLRLQQQLQQA